MAELIPRELPNADLREHLLWLFRKRRRYMVTGRSMHPLLSAGEEVLLDPGAYRKRLPERDQIVVAFHPARPGLKIIKRVAAVNPDGTVVLRGDNPAESTDYNSIPADKIIGRVTSRFA